MAHFQFNFLRNFFHYILSDLWRVHVSLFICRFSVHWLDSMWVNLQICWSPTPHAPSLEACFPPFTSREVCELSRGWDCPSSVWVLSQKATYHFTEKWNLIRHENPETTGQALICIRGFKLSMGKFVCVLEWNPTCMQGPSVYENDSGGGGEERFSRICWNVDACGSFNLA